MCSPWTTADLAAHLVIRESRPDLAIGILIPQLTRRLDEAMVALAATPWAELVDQVRQGPPAWAPTRLGLVDERTNMVEFFVHHEDVLRTEAGYAEPRALGQAHEQALWRTVSLMGRLLARRAPTGVVVVARGFGRAALRAWTSGHGCRARSSGELVLFLYGRQRVADVALEGSPRDVAALRSGSLGV